MTAVSRVDMGERNVVGSSADEHQPKPAGRTAGDEMSLPSRLHVESLGGSRRCASCNQYTHWQFHWGNMRWVRCRKCWFLEERMAHKAWKGWHR